MLRRKERKIEQICKVKEIDEDLYTLKINCKGKSTVGKANKGINVEKNIIGLKKLKIKIIKKRKEKKEDQICKVKQRQMKIYIY